MDNQRRLRELAGIRMQEETMPTPKIVLQIDLYSGYAETASPADFMDAQEHGSLEDEGYERVEGGKEGPHGGGSAVVYKGEEDMWVLIY